MKLRQKLTRGRLLQDSQNTAIWTNWGKIVCPFCPVQCRTWNGALKLSLARNNMQYFVATYMYLDLPWEKPDTTTLSFLLQLTGYLIWQKLLSFCLKLMILLFVRQFAVGWFPKFATDKWPFPTLSSHFFANYIHEYLSQKRLENRN